MTTAGQLPTYGAAPWYPGDAPGPMKPARAPLNRRRLNLYAIFLIVLIPWGFFVGTYALASFRVPYLYPNLFYALLVCSFFLIVAFAALSLQQAWKRKKLGKDAVDPSWVAFLFWTLLIAWVVGLGAGWYNYSEYMREYYDLDSWSDYKEVSPLQTRGNDILDAGTVVFVNNTKLDLALSTGYTSGDTYCVAPVVEGNSSLALYDFWAVGKNCCGSHGSKFSCDGYHDDDLRGPPPQYSGTRYTGDEVAFYTLAVERAEAAHHIQSGSRIFLNYAKNPTNTRDDLAEDGYHNQFVWCIAYFVFQLVVVLIAVRVIGGSFFNESLL